MQSARFGFAALLAPRFSIAMLTLGFSAALLPPAFAQTPTNRTGELGSPNLQSPPVSPLEEAEPPRLPRSPRSSPPAIEQLQKSVAVRESIRAQLRGLSQADQQAYTRSIADDYRLLAELLRRQNRDREAQAVLDLL